ncbi:MAG: UDP-N-acetylmuramate--L-alanine ligase [Deltaproteobacteria bacterium]
MTPIPFRHIHFIGIGGIGVSGLARLALKAGVRVSGSDVRESAVTQALRAAGAQVVLGHRGQNVGDAECVVYSSAIRPDNPEMVAARTRHLTVKKRAEFLCDLMEEKTVVAVAGAHGKTTTSSLAAKLLTAAGLCPTVAVGGILREEGDNAHCGESRFFVAEADESDGTFLCYTPTYSLVTNIDQEHMDHYKTYDNLLCAFAAYLKQTAAGGCVIACADDAALADLASANAPRLVTYGFSPRADVFIEKFAADERTIRFSCSRRGRSLGAFTLSLCGRHNALNAAAVIALGLELDLDPRTIREALASFRGVERRFEVRHEDRDVMIVDDYGHHPTEIVATLAGARERIPGRLVVVFQPHRYTRTQALFDRFAKSFSHCDHLLVTDIYAANEDPIEGVTAENLVERIRANAACPVSYAPRPDLVGRVRAVVRPGDCVLFLGAGDITKASHEFAAFYKK